MILVDTSVWVDHFRVTDDRLAHLLEQRAVLTHPCIIGELALGGLHRRPAILASLSKLPLADLASHQDALILIDSADLDGTGVGYVDVQLLASTRLTRGAKLWTRDRRLRAQAQKLDLAAILDH